MQSLFPQAAQGGVAPLCQFSAGKCNLVQLPDGKFRVTPDPRRGTISITKSNDGMIHFKWANGVSGAVEDDRIVFPGENVFKRVNTGKPGDRVYMLQYITGNQRLMYWMQNPSDATDSENLKRVNELITNPAAAVPPAPAATAGTAVGPEQWMQMLGLAPPAAPGAEAPAAVPVVNNSGFGNLDLSSLLNPAAVRPATAAAPAATPPASAAAAAPATQAPTPATAPAVAAPAAGGLTIEDLQRAMFGAQNQQAQAQGQGGARGARETPALQNIVLAEDVIASGVLQDPDVQRELLSMLPEDQQTEDHLEGTVRSAQFRQALGSLTHAVQHPDNFQSVMSNFGINPEPGMNQLVRGDGVGAFLTSVQAANPAATDSSSSSTTVPVTPANTEANNSEASSERVNNNNNNNGGTDGGDAPMDQE